eukprot:1897722-Pyramimonas_sp.AAC.1
MIAATMIRIGGTCGGREGSPVSSPTTSTTTTATNTTSTTTTTTTTTATNTTSTTTTTTTTTAAATTTTTHRGEHADGEPLDHDGGRAGDGGSGDGAHGHVRVGRAVLRGGANAQPGQQAHHHLRKGVTQGCHARVLRSWCYAAGVTQLAAAAAAASLAGDGPIRHMGGRYILTTDQSRTGVRVI